MQKGLNHLQFHQQELALRDNPVYPSMGYVGVTDCRRSLEDTASTP